MPERQCEQCGNAYTPHQHNQRFCTRICSDAWWRDTRREGVDLLRNSYFGRGLVDADAPGGQFARVTERTVIGASPSAQTAAPNWSRDPVPPEPPLGIDVEAVPDLGFPQEGGCHAADPADR